MALTVVTLGVLVTLSDGSCVTVTVACAVDGVIAVPLGPVPRPVAVLTTLPASMSAWVIALVAVHVMAAPGASVDPSAGVQVSAEVAIRLSLTCTLLASTLPSFLTVMV